MGPRKNRSGPKGLGFLHVEKYYNNFPSKKEDLLVGHVLYIYFALGDYRQCLTKKKLMELCQLHFKDLPYESSLNGKIALVVRTQKKFKTPKNFNSMEKYKNWCNEPFSISLVHENLDNTSDDVDKSQLDLSNVSNTSIKTQTEDHSEDLKYIKKELKQCRDKHSQLLKSNRDRARVHSFKYVKKERFDEAVKLIVSLKEENKKLNSEIRQLTYQLINCEKIS
ncbi:unnamed protein product [Lepeophtheirus salmonis]|uniref:(salmon louse) hypothetical protein n=1 Tax=Lepeophtheirus salmonis TaxID=72036 RepID=A0A7R8CXH1_LEPSM|nr:unnamed protein product [Lepeophtheirus salmonis]CAF2960843.1 unnamed protein product [Lepeophtheirus salmonis]